MKNLKMILILVVIIFSQMACTTVHEAVIVEKDTMVSDDFSIKKEINETIVKEFFNNDTINKFVYLIK